jgi:predicted ArsR family transcriptional regulator
MVQLVSKAELLWVVDHMEPVWTRELAAVVPIDQNSVYVRLRHLDRSALVDTQAADRQGRGRYRWVVTDAGRDRLAETDLPPATVVDFESYFAGRAASIDPVMILEALSVQEDTWHPSSDVYEALPFSKKGIRDNLHALREDGAVELDRGKTGTTYRWRLTDRGRRRLAEADETQVPEFVWVD